MKKQDTDFALLAGAFATDQHMATQVSKLLADGDVSEAQARVMLRLVRDGKLKGESQCNHWWPYNYWYATPAPRRQWEPWCNTSGTITASDTNAMSISAGDAALTDLVQPLAEAMALS